MRLDGVGEIRIAGGNEYAMRVWLDIEKMTHVDLTAGEVVQAIRNQNIQVAAGVIGQPPISDTGDFQLNVTTQGRLIREEEFGDIIVKRGDDGRVTRLRDVARIELGAQDYSRLSYLDGKSAIAVLVYQRPGTNAVDTAAEVKQTMVEMSQDFPQGIGYEIAYNPTDYVEESIAEVFETLFITTDVRRADGVSFLARLATDNHSRDRNSDLIDRYVRGDAVSRRHSEHTCHCSDWCWRSGSSWMTRLLWLRTSSV